MPSGAEVLTLISEVKMSQPYGDMGGASDPALSSKPREKEWQPDVFISKMTFPVQFVGIF